MEKFEKTIEEVAYAIRGWELYAGESFTDYFLDSAVPDNVWYGFLLGKGFVEKAAFMETFLAERKYCYDLDKFEPFEYYNEEEFIEEEYLKNIFLWAELILGSNMYYNKFKEFLIGYFNECEES